MSNIQMINFNNQKLLTVEKDGIKYVAVKPICENLGLDWSSQKKRIERDDVLNSTMVIMTTVAEDEKSREMTCLPIDYINGFLFGIDTSRVSEEIRPLVLYYKRECYKALFEFWNKSKEEEEPSKSVEPKPLPGSLEDKFNILKATISMTSLSPIAKETLLLTTVEENFDLKIPYRPVIERKTISATEVGKILGISSNRVGKLANEYNLKTEEYGRMVLSKSMYSPKQVEQFLYYEDKIIPKLKEILCLD